MGSALRSLVRAFGATVLTFVLGATVFGIGVGSAAQQRHTAKQQRDFPSLRALRRAHPVGKRLVQAGVPAGSRELVGQRTRTSRTFLNPYGSHVSIVSAGSLNYRDAAGSWQPINNSLLKSSAPGYALTNAANGYQLQLPKTLDSAPVLARRGKSTVSFQLLGAKGTARSVGSSVTYANALRNTNVVYQATSDAIKESLTLKSRQAPRAFHYRLLLSRDLHARATRSGWVNFFNKQHRRVFSFEPAWMIDRAGARSHAVAMRLHRSHGGYTLDLIPSRRWLSSGRRVYPVTVDPSMNTGPVDCYLASNAPDTSYCGGATLKVGYDGATKYRAPMTFDLSAFDRSDVVLNAELDLNIESKTTANVATVGAYQLTRAWDGTATWNSAQVNTSGVKTLWTTAGGDYTTTAAATASAGGTTGSLKLFPTQIAQNWISDPSSNDGLLLKQAAENVSNVLTLTSAQGTGASPLLVLTYNYGAGDWGHYTQVAQQQIDDHLGFSVNASTGNLLVTAQDGGLTRIHNSLSSDRELGGGGEFAYEWTMGSGVDTYLEFFNDGSVAYHDGTGSALPYTPTGDGTHFNPPASADGDLVKNADGSYTLLSFGDATTQKFNASGLLVSSADLNGNATTFSYVTSGGCCAGTWQLSSVTAANGLTTSFTYDATTGYLTKVTDAGSRSYTYTYDPLTDDLKSVTDPAGKVTSFVYSSGDITKITDPNGNVVTFTYDLANRVTSFTRKTADLTNPTTSFTYNSADNFATPPYNVVLTDPNSHTTTYYYDGQFRVTKVTDAKGNSVQTSYTDGAGSLGYSATDPRYCGTNDNVCAVKDANGNISNFGYSQTNQQNQLWSQSALQGTTNRPSFAYGDVNHPYWASRSTNPQSGSWNSKYDENMPNHNGNLTSQGDEAGSGGTAQAPVSFTYNFDATGHPQGTIKTAVDAKGNTTTYTYTYSGTNAKLLTQMVVNPPSPLPATTINYDSLGRVASEVDGNANTRTYTYDALDRTKTITYSHTGQTSSTITYNYDADGNVTSMVDDTGTTSNTYDALNRLTKETRPGGGTTQYAYDKASNLTALTDAGGTTSYLYDSTNLLSKITEPNNNQTTFGYDANGNRTSITYPGSVVGTLGYDASNRIHTISWVKGGTTSLASYTYSYADPNTGKDTDVRQSVVSLLSGDSQSTTTSYGYDYFGRLTSANSTGGSTSTYSYAYDVNGNRTSQTVNGSSTYYLYNAANGLCWSGATSPSGYSCLSLPSGGKTYSYDSNGNMLTGSSNSFAYNSKNQTSSITPNGGSAINMTYTGPGQARRTAVGSNGYINDTLGVASEGSTYYVRDIGGTVLGERNPVGGSGSYYFLFDALGSVVAVCDASGTLRDTFKYDPFGAATSASAPVTNPWRYAGGYVDSSTGLYKFGERYYDQTIGRWTQLDPVNDPLETRGWNRYTYVGDDPTNAVDPSGRMRACDRGSFTGVGYSGTYHCVEQAIDRWRAHCVRAKWKCRPYDRQASTPWWLSACLNNALPWGVLGAFAEDLARKRLEEKVASRVAVRIAGKGGPAAAAMACAQGVLVAWAYG